MKNELIIDIDTDRKNTILIKKPESVKPPKNEEEAKQMVLLDMASLCEALCTLIHVADQNGIKPGPDSLRDCIKHLESGFVDASYKGILKEKGEGG